jgi:hypothetical protein
MYELAIAVPAFNKPFVLWDLQPNARMSQRAFTPVTGHAVGGHDPGLWRVLAHGMSLKYRFVAARGYAQQRLAGQGRFHSRSMRN